MKIIRIFISLVVTMFLSVNVLNAGNKLFCLYYSTGGGIHSFRYQLENGNRSNAMGAFLEAGYFNPINKHWKWGIAGNLSLSGSYCDFSYIQTSDRIDGENYDMPFEYRIYLSQFNERQNVATFGVPISILYRTKLNKQWSFWGSAGIAGQIPIYSRFKTSGSIETRGYYPDFDIELYNIPHHGYFEDKRSRYGIIDCKSYVSISVSLGCSKQIKANRRIFFGSYYTQGCTNFIEYSENELVDSELDYAGLFSSKLVHSSVPFSVGLKVGIIGDFQRNWELNDFMKVRSSRVQLRKFERSIKQKRKDYKRVTARYSSSSSKRKENRHGTMFRTNYGKQYRNRSNRSYNKDVRTTDKTYKVADIVETNEYLQSDSIALVYDSSINSVNLDVKQEEWLRMNAIEINKNAGSQLIVRINGSSSISAEVKDLLLRLGFLEDRIEISENKEDFFNENLKNSKVCRYIQIDYK